MKSRQLLDHKIVASDGLGVGLGVTKDTHGGQGLGLGKCSTSGRERVPETGLIELNECVVGFWGTAVPTKETRTVTQNLRREQVNLIDVLVESIEPISTNTRTIATAYKLRNSTLVPIICFCSCNLFKVVTANIVNGSRNQIGNQGMTQRPKTFESSLTIVTTKRNKGWKSKSKEHSVVMRSLSPGAVLATHNKPECNLGKSLSEPLHPQLVGAILESELTIGQPGDMVIVKRKSDK